MISEGSCETIDYGIDRCFSGIRSFKPYETDRYVNQRIMLIVAAIDYEGDSLSDSCDYIALNSIVSRSVMTMAARWLT